MKIKFLSSVLNKTSNFFRSKNRKAWVVPACLSTQNSTMSVTFRAWGHIGKIVNEKSGDTIQQHSWEDEKNPLKLKILENNLQHALQGS